MTDRLREMARERDALRSVVAMVVGPFGERLKYDPEKLHGACRAVLSWPVPGAVEGGGEAAASAAVRDDPAPEAVSERLREVARDWIRVGDQQGTEVAMGPRAVWLTDSLAALLARVEGERDATVAALVEALGRVLPWHAMSFAAHEDKRTETEIKGDAAFARTVLADAAAAGRAHDVRIKAEGVLAAWTHGWQDEPGAIAKPTMEEALAFVRALSPGTADAGEP